MMGLGSFGDLHLGRREMLHMGLSGRSCRESQELSKLYSKTGSTTALWYAGIRISPFMAIMAK